MGAKLRALPKSLNKIALGWSKPKGTLNWPANIYLAKVQDPHGRFGGISDSRSVMWSTLGLSLDFHNYYGF